MTLIILVMLIAGSLSFICSVMEASLYAIPPSRIEALKKRRILGSELLGRLRENIDEPIAAILTFNTIANTVGGLLLGALVAQRFGHDSPMLLVFAFIFTLQILLFSEILPKTIGVLFADLLAPKLAYLMRFLILTLYPFVWLSRGVTKMIRASSESQKKVSEQEIIELARLGVAEGALYPEEARWVENALRLNEKTAHDLMTPRVVVYQLPAELPMSLVQMHSEHWTHSRLPLCRNNDPDKVVGIVYRREVFDTLLEKSDEELAAMKISELAHEAEFVPETMRGHELLHRFLNSRMHLFIVTNEHGGLEGVVTLEDVLEELLGTEIVEHHDLHVDMQEYARRLAEKRRELYTNRPSAESGSTPADKPAR